MGYVAIRGGERAIREAAEVLEALRARGADAPLQVSQIEHQLRALHGRVLSEGGVYDTRLAALAIKQSGGDTFEAAFLLRAWRSTRPRLRAPVPISAGSMRLIRRISAAFKDVEGGQRLGPTPDYSVRLFRFELLDESPLALQELAARFLNIEPHDACGEFPKVLDGLRQRGFLPERCGKRPEAFDITRESLAFPAPRSAVLATMARAETGSLLALAYSNMRGYGDVHPTVAELRVGYAPVFAPHPATGEPVEAGEILMTECEVVAMYESPDAGSVPTFTIGYGACFGHNEVKAISMAILDRALQNGAAQGPANPSEDAEFVLLHIDGIESMGFCTHYKMPHYVTFASDIDRLQATQEQRTEAVA